MSRDEVEVHRPILLVLLLTTFMVFLPIISADFVNIDDLDYTTRNDLVLNPDLIQTFSLETRTLADWTPLVTLSHALEYLLGGMNPGLMHWTNILLHLVSIALLFHLFRRLGVRPDVALCAVAVFALHPLQVESVAWISARKNLLCMVFGLAFLTEFCKARYLFALFWLLLACGSKGTVIAFPFAALPIVWFARVPAPTPTSRRWAAFFLSLGIARALLSVASQHEVIAARQMAQLSFFERMPLIGSVFLHQLRQFFWPHDLSFRYFRNTPLLVSSETALIAAACTAVLAAIFFVGWRNRTIALTALIALFFYLPTANFVPSPEIQADRYTHLALGWVALLVLQIAVMLPRRFHLALAPLFALWIPFVLVPKTESMLARWDNSASLWASVLEIHPNYPFGWTHLGFELVNRKDYSGAVRSFERALALEPANTEARFNLTLLYQRAGLLDKALEQAREFSRLQPESTHGYRLEGTVLFELRRLDEALAALNRACEIQPSDARSRLMRAKVFLAQKNRAAAEADIKWLYSKIPKNAEVAELYMNGTQAR